MECDSRAKMLVLNGHIMNSQWSDRYECKKNGYIFSCRRNWIQNSFL